MFKSSKVSGNTALRYVILAAVGLFLMYPLLWMIGSAFKQSIDIFGSLGILPPGGRVAPENFSAAWQLSRQHNIAYYFGNTLKFLLPKTFFTIISCIHSYPAR